MADYSNSIAQAQEKMRLDGSSARAIRVFSRYAEWLADGVTGLIPESSIDPIPGVANPNDAASEQANREALSKTVMIKLNGGLGTSMGMEKAKSLLPVRDGLRFLDIICNQIRVTRETYGVKLPLILMNSFRTRDDSLAALPADIAVDSLPLDIVQGREPKLRADTLAPVEWDANPSLEWCPPGHGDIFTTLLDTGLVEKLLEAGYRYMFSSNADNLGAAPSAKLAGWFASSGADYAPEMCLRTPADRKGGHLAIRKADGRTILRDTAQTPDEDMHFFTDETVHPYFHTNNLWFNLESLHKLLTETDGLLELPLIKNRKNVDPTDASSPEVFQIECAIGAIVEKFENVTPVLVGRERFLPVKTTNDLLLLRSDVYRLSDEYHLLTTGNVPNVDLDKKFFKTISQFDERFRTVPSISKASSFTVNGDWRFDGEQSFSGVVELNGNGSFGA